MKYQDLRRRGLIQISTLKQVDDKNVLPLVEGVVVYIFDLMSAGQLDESFAPDPATDAPHLESTAIRSAGCMGSYFRTIGDKR